MSEIEQDKQVIQEPKDNIQQQQQDLEKEQRSDEDSKQKSLEKTAAGFSSSKSRSRSRRKKKHRKRSYSRSRDRDRHKKSKKRKYSRSRSRSERKKSKKHKSKKRSSRSRSKSRRKSKKESKKSNSNNREQNYQKFMSHYGNLVQTKDNNKVVPQQQKHENSGLYWNGFNWISPEVQNNKIIRSVTIYGLPLDKCKFSNDDLTQFLTIFMAQHRLADTGNQFPISSCFIDEEATTALIEFSSIEECQRVSILQTIPILDKECKIVKSHDSNPYNQTLGLQQAQTAAKAQAVAMQAMSILRDDMQAQKKGVKQENMVIPNLLAPISGVTDDVKNQVQSTSLDAFKELAKVEQPEQQQTQQLQPPVELPPLPGSQNPHLPPLPQNL